MKANIALASALALAIGTGTASAQDRTLRIATSVPQDHYLTVSIAKFAEQVTERTDGAIAFEIYPAQSLVTDQQMDQAVASGIVDIGVGSASILAGTIPALNIFGVPFYFDTRDKLNQAVSVGSPIRETLDAEIEKVGLNAVFWIPYGSIAMAMRDEPVHTPAEMKGKKIRSFSATASQFIESVGAAPVVTSGGEQFLALQRGLVDGGLTGWSSFTGRRLYDVAKYAVATDHSYETHFALMKQSNWMSLSAGQQQIFQEVGKELESVLLDEVFGVVDDVKSELAGKMEIIELTPEEKLLWKEATAPIAAQFTDGADPVSLAVFAEAEKIQ